MKIFGAIVIVLLSLNAVGQQKMTPEKLWSLGRVSIDDVSINGDSVLYGVTFYDVEENKGKRQLYLWTDNNGAPLTVQVSKEDKSVSNGLLLPNTKIGYLKSGAFYVMNADGSDIQLKSASESGISILKYSPDYSRVLYVKDVKYMKICRIAIRSIKRQMRFHTKS